MTIGQWVRRRDSRQKWHLIESIVAGEPVVRCGRRFLTRGYVDPESVFESVFETSDVMPLTRMIGQPQLCQVCQ